MNRRCVCAVLSLLLLCTLLLPLSGCYFAAHPDVEGLTAAEVRKIRWVYYRNRMDADNEETDVGKNIGRITIQQCLLKIDGKTIVKIEDTRYWHTLMATTLQLEIIDGVVVGTRKKAEQYMVYVPTSNEQKETVIYLREAYQQSIFTKADIVRIAEAEQAIVGSFGYYVEHPTIDGLTDEQVRQIRWAFRIWLAATDRVDKIEIVRKVGDFQTETTEYGKATVVLVRDKSVVGEEATKTIDEVVDGVPIGQRKGNERYCVYIDSDQRESMQLISVDDYKYIGLTQSDLEKIAELEREATQTN